jgi:anti-anti-sigma factor
LTQVPDIAFPVAAVSGVPVVTVPQEVDVNNADRLRAALAEAAAQGNGTLVVDMTQTQFCDTAGLHALVSANKRALAGGRQVLLAMRGAAVLRIFAITGLDTVIPHFTSLEQALAQASPRSSTQDRQTRRR